MKKKKIDIFKNSGYKDERYEDWFGCTNPDCHCDTILEDYHFCPMCGLAINWIEGSAPKETKTVVIEQSDYYLHENHKWYICPNCEDRYIEYPDHQCIGCKALIEWE